MCVLHSGHRPRPEFTGRIKTTPKRLHLILHNLVQFLWIDFDQFEASDTDDVNRARAMAHGRQLRHSMSMKPALFGSCVLGSGLLIRHVGLLMGYYYYSFQLDTLDSNRLILNLRTNDRWAGRSRDPGSFSQRESAAGRVFIPTTPCTRQRQRN